MENNQLSKKQQVIFIIAIILITIGILCFGLLVNFFIANIKAKENVANIDTNSIVAGFAGSLGIGLGVVIIRVLLLLDGFLCLIFNGAGLILSIVNLISTKSILKYKSLAILLTIISSILIVSSLILVVLGMTIDFYYKVEITTTTTSINQ